jgi:hypothetical protein
VTIFLLLVGLVAILAMGLNLRWPIGDDSEPVAIDQPAPAEFLYLDSQRAFSYLAQMEGGTITSEEQSHKSSRNVTSELALKGLFHAGATSEEEEAAQRVVTPTAASSYIALINTLRANKDLVNIPDIGDFDHFERAVKEGQFVLFKAESMTPPTYTNLYLAVRQGDSLNALFPVVGDEANRQRALEIRRAAHRFVDQVGTNPRIVFNLQPDGERASAPHYLLPVQYAGLSHERSLIKNGGGAFQVLGKVVRIFPEPREEEQKAGASASALKSWKAYIDPTGRNTWSEPLKHAAPELICRAESHCAQAVTRNPEASEEVTEVLRRELGKDLSKQTQIKIRGAVILPVAIYK